MREYFDYYDDEDEDEGSIEPFIETMEHRIDMEREDGRETETEKEN